MSWLISNWEDQTQSPKPLWVDLESLLAWYHSWSYSLAFSYSVYLTTNRGIPFKCFCVCTRRPEFVFVNFNQMEFHFTSNYRLRARTWYSSTIFNTALIIETWLISHWNNYLTGFLFCPWNNTKSMLMRLTNISTSCFNNNFLKISSPAIIEHFHWRLTLPSNSFWFLILVATCPSALRSSHAIEFRIFLLVDAPSKSYQSSHMICNSTAEA